MMDKGARFEVGLVGAGHISQFHIHALARVPNARIVGIADTNKALAEAVRARFALPAAYESIDALIDAGADVVHILTPPETHARLAIQALRRACHVYVEKPLATDPFDCDLIAEAASRVRKTVCVGHSLLRDPLVARGLRLASAGAIGEPMTVDYFRCQSYPPYVGGPLPICYRQGGYPFRDLGVHALYLLEAFLGPIETISPHFAATGRDPNLHFDEWRVLVGCARGTGHIQMSWNVRPQQNMLVVQGTEGVMRIDMFGMSVSLKRRGRLPEHASRVLNSVSEGTQIATQAVANLGRVVTGRARQFHGLQTLVVDFYKALSRNEPAPVAVAHAKPIVAWTESVARAADAAKGKAKARYAATLTAPVLVTGAAGFIGSRLVERLLANGERVRVFVRRDPPAAWIRNPGIEIAFGDLGDPEAVDRAVAGTELVYHVGAAMRGTPQDFQRGTIAGTRNVVDSIIRHGTARLVYVSSLSVLHAACSAGEMRITEDWPLEPRADERGWYTRAKLEAENYVTTGAKERGLRVVTLRPGEVIGVSNDLVSPGVAQRLGRRAVVLGNGQVPLPMVFVEDLIDAMLSAARGDRFDGSVFHIVDSHEVTQNDLLNIAARSGTDLKITRVPLSVVLGCVWLAQAAAKLIGRSTPVSMYRIRTVAARRRFDCTVAETVLGWRPRVGVKAALAARSGSPLATEIVRADDVAYDAAAV